MCSIRIKVSSGLFGFVQTLWFLFFSRNSTRTPVHSMSYNPAENCIILSIVSIVNCFPFRPIKQMVIGVLSPESGTESTREEWECGKEKPKGKSMRCQWDMNTQTLGIQREVFPTELLYEFHWE